MTEKIGETLKKLAGATSKANSPTTSSPKPTESPAAKDVCPLCGGSGFLRQDLPLDHPDFGRLQPCVCRHEQRLSYIRDHLFSLSHLDQLKRMTFDTFSPRGRVGLGEQQQKSIERAFNQARLFADRLEGWLLLQGGYGSGKTHLAAAIANHCVERGIPTLFLTVPDLLDTLRFAYEAEDVTFEERFDQVRRAPLLILDDFGTQHATAWAQEKLFQILNFRYTNRLPLVVTTNLPLEQIEGRMRSRIADPELVTRVVIMAPDYRRPADDTEQHELSSIGLHAHQTLGNFNVRKGENLSPEAQRSLESALDLANAFAQEPSGWLVFLGPHGCGKTHLAAAIANYRASQGYPVMMVMVADLLDHLRATFSPDSTASYDQRFEDVRTADLLILDDLGTQASTPWVREKLSQLFNYRYDTRLPTVITSSSKLEEVDPGVRAKMLDQRLCRIKVIDAPAYTGGPPKRRKIQR